MRFTRRRISAFVEGDVRCDLCLEDFADEPNRSIYDPPCNHLIHTDCARGISNNSCPRCRRALFPENGPAMPLAFEHWQQNLDDENADTDSDIESNSHASEPSEGEESDGDAHPQPNVYPELLPAQLHQFEAYLENLDHHTMHTPTDVSEIRMGTVILETAKAAYNAGNKDLFDIALDQWSWVQDFQDGGTISEWNGPVSQVGLAIDSVLLSLLNDEIPAWCKLKIRYAQAFRSVDRRIAKNVRRSTADGDKYAIPTVQQTRLPDSTRQLSFPSIFRRAVLGMSHNFKYPYGASRACYVSRWIDAGWNFSEVYGPVQDFLATRSNEDWSIDARNDNIDLCRHQRPPRMGR